MPHTHLTEEDGPYQREINLNIRKIPNRFLSAPQSRYRTANYHRCVVTPGRGLVCSSDIQEGQAIAHFKGTIIDHATYENMTNTRSQYVLRLFEESDLMKYKRTCHSHLGHLDLPRVPSLSRCTVYATSQYISYMRMYYAVGKHQSSPTKGIPLCSPSRD